MKLSLERKISNKIYAFIGYQRSFKRENRAFSAVMTKDGKEYSCLCYDLMVSRRMDKCVKEIIKLVESHKEATK